MQLGATKQQLQEVEKDIFQGIQKGRWAVFVGKFEHGFGTQLGAVLLWRRVHSGCLQLGATKQQLQETENEIFSRNSERTLGSFIG